MKFVFFQNEIDSPKPQQKPTNNYEVNSRNNRAIYSANNQGEGEEEDEDDEDSELYRFECESGDGEEIDDETGKINSKEKKL